MYGIKVCNIDLEVRQTGLGMEQKLDVDIVRGPNTIARSDRSYTVFGAETPYQRASAWDWATRAGYTECKRRPIKTINVALMKF